MVGTRINSMLIINLEFRRCCTHETFILCLSKGRNTTIPSPRQEDSLSQIKSGLHSENRGIACAHILDGIGRIVVFWRDGMSERIQWKATCHQTNPTKNGCSSSSTNWMGAAMTSERIRATRHSLMMTRSCSMAPVTFQQALYGLDMVSIVFTFSSISSHQSRIAQFGFYRCCGTKVWIQN
jgi:hypothetical protein